ncbi:MAG: hypothetical protein JWP30_1828 [Homoserinimonas sp.]|jgi:hypothetical protein|nr:hypothetical protein [Homoserinimonas sp.]
MSDRPDADEAQPRSTRLLVSELRQAVVPAFTPSRILIALKTAIAAVSAWLLGAHLPGALDEYAYYAPLGALISMTPTLMGSLRSSVQTVVGLALGIGLAWAVNALNVPAIVGVLIAVGAGVLIAGFRSLGPGREYVPIAALFVLIVGGPQAEDYSLGYLAQMGVGMLVGVLINVLVVPPLYFTSSSREITRLRTAIVTTVTDIADALEESWPPKNVAWQRQMSSLSTMVLDAQPIVDEAQESRKINPRAKRRDYDVQEDADDLDALGRLTRHTLDLGEAISGAIWFDPVKTAIPAELCSPLSAALRRMGDLVRAWENRDQEENAAAAAEKALAKLSEKFDQHRGVPSSAVGAVIFDLRRMLTIVQSRLRSRR